MNVYSSRRHDVVGLLRSGLGGIIGKQVGDVMGRQQSKADAPTAAGTTVTPPTVGDKTANTTSNAENNGRAALISTSPSGVSGLDPTGRRKLLGND